MAYHLLDGGASKEGPALRIKISYSSLDTLARSFFRQQTPVTCQILQIRIFLSQITVNTPSTLHALPVFADFAQPVNNAGEPRVVDQ
jgi:hypothetical protein